MSTIQEQLTQELADIEWRDLIPHSQRDAIIVVDPALDLVEAGVAIARDRVAVVQGWIQEQLIQKPTAQQLSAWNQAPDTKFSTLIVQPYVLISTRLSEV